MRNKLLPMLVAGLATFFCHSCINQQQDANGPVYEILTPKKYNALQQKYSAFDDFENGTAKVMSNNYWGLINANGKEILTVEYDSISPLSNSHRLIMKSSKCGIVDKQGKIIIPCKYDAYMYQDKKDNIFAFQLNGKWGFVSEKDEIKIQFKYDSFTNIADSVFVGKIKGTAGLFDYEDNTIIAPEYDNIIYRPVDDSKVSYAKKGEKYALINSKNEVVTKCEYPFDLPYGDYITMKSYIHDRFCLVRWETGEVVIPYGRYEELGDYVEGMLYACKNDKFGYINPNNEIIIPFKFADAKDFSEGLAMVAVIKGYYTTWWGGRKEKLAYGFIEKTGSFVIQPTFANQSLAPGNGFKEGLAVMGVERSDNIYPDKYGYIDTTGKWAIKPVYSDADDFVDGVAVIKTIRGYGAINKLGEIIVEPEYDGYDYRGWHKDKIVFKNDDGQKFEYSLTGVAL